MARAPDSLPEELPSVFTAGQARALGISSRRLNQGDIIRVARGVYAFRTGLTPQPNTDHPAELWRKDQSQRARTLAAHLPPNVFYSRRTAAALWRLPTPPRRGNELDVSCFAPHNCPRQPGFIGSRIRPWLVEVVEHAEARVTDPASTWAMLAPQLRLEDGVALGDAVIRRKRMPGTTRILQAPLADIESLRVIADQHRTGAAQLRKLIPLLSTQSASAPETHLRLLIASAELPAPCLDYDVFDSRGRLLGCSEFAYPDVRLAVEYEGSHHLVTAQQWDRDIEKYRDYTAAGWEVIRVTARSLYVHPERLKLQLLEALRRRGWRVADEPSAM